MPEYTARPLTSAEIAAADQEQINSLYEDYRSLGELAEQPETSQTDKGWIKTIRDDIALAIRHLTRK